MNYQEFLQVIKDARLLSASFTTDDARKLFEFLVGSEELGSMVYRDFLEALCALSSYKVPEPWTPLDERLRLFLKRDFMPMFAKTKSKRK